MTIECLTGSTRLFHVEEDYDRVFWSPELPADLGGNGSCLDKVARTGSSRYDAEPAGQSNEGAAGCNEISKTREELTLVFALGETTHSPRTSKANETNHLGQDCHLGELTHLNPTESDRPRLDSEVPNPLSKPFEGFRRPAVLRHSKTRIPSSPSDIGTVNPRPEFSDVNVNSEVNAKVRIIQLRPSPVSGSAPDLEVPRPAKA